MQKIVLRFGKIKLESTYSNLPAGVANEVSRCLSENEPFGLSDGDSIYIISSRDNVVIFVAKDLSHVLQVFTTEDHLLFFIHTLLYTHTIIADYRTVGILLNRININNEPDRPTLLLPNAS